MNTDLDFKFDGNKPMSLTATSSEHSSLDESQQKIAGAVGRTVEAYLRATKALLESKYFEFKGIVPAFLSSPGQVLISCGSDGIAIRYERRHENHSIIVMWRSQPLAVAVSMLSQKVVRCWRSCDSPDMTLDDGVRVQLRKTSGETGETTVIYDLLVGINASLELPPTLPAPPHRPFCLLSAISEMNLRIDLEELDPKTNTPRPMAATTKCPIPVGWDGFEVFPYLDPAVWQPQNASLWAEMDILSWVVAQHNYESTINALDARAELRRSYELQLEEFKAHLDSNPRNEEQLHQFLKDHPRLICPDFVMMWSKLPIGPHVTDFVFRDAADSYLLVEIERSTLKLFRKDGELSSNLQHAISQTRDWNRYIADNIQTVRGETPLRTISSSPRSLVIIGRSSELTERKRRSLAQLETETPSRRIMTYDDVYLNARSVVENMVGPLGNVLPNTKVLYLQS